MAVTMLKCTWLTVVGHPPFLFFVVGFLQLQSCLSEKGQKCCLKQQLYFSSQHTYGCFVTVNFVHYNILNLQFFKMVKFR